MAPPRARRFQPLLAGLVGLAFAGFTAFPAVTSPPRDSFPHSNYPMFSHPIDAVGWLPAAFGEDAAGAVVRLEPLLIGGSREPIHAAETVQDAIRNGDADRLCSEIGQRVADARRAEVQRIVVATEQHHYVRSLGGDHEPEERRVAASCVVPR